MDRIDIELYQDGGDYSAGPMIGGPKCGEHIARPDRQPLRYYSKGVHGAPDCDGEYHFDGLAWRWQSR